MKECLICGGPLKLIKFKCADGYVCKGCYEKVSVNFTQTIKTKNKDELLALLEGSTKETTTPTFEISRKINQLIFFDDKNQKICLPNHKKYTKEKLKLGRIKVVLTVQQETRDIWLIPNFINRDSTAYKTMRSLASNIVVEVNQLKEEVAC